MQNHYSIVVVQLFYSQMSSKLFCLTSNIGISYYDPFIYFSLLIPDVKFGNFILQLSLKTFFTPEILKAQDAWYKFVPCNPKYEAQKSLSINQVTYILIIWLNWYTPGVKVNIDIDISWSLDMSKYIWIQSSGSKIQLTLELGETIPL